jgi:hypothetical protein
VEPAFLHTPASQEIEALRERLKLAPITFLYPAAAWPHKNHERLIRAFVAAAIDDSQLLLTGGRQDASPLPALIEELGASDTVRPVGPRHDRRAALPISPRDGDDRPQRV